VRSICIKSAKLNNNMARKLRVVCVLASSLVLAKRFVCSFVFHARGELTLIFHSCSFPTEAEIDLSWRSHVKGGMILTMSILRY